MAPQKEYVPRNYEVDSSFAESASSIFLESKGAGKRPAVKLSVEAIRPGLFRTSFTSNEHPLPPRPSVPRPNNAVANGVHAPEPMSEKRKQIFNGDVVACIDFEDVPVVTIGFQNQKQPLYSDLPFRSYVLDGPGVAHYTRYNKNTLHVGLGEKAAPMNLSNRKFALDATDAFGHDVHRTDPLYKHIPLLINATPEGVVATFSSSYSRGAYSVGSIMDGLWSAFKCYQQDYGGLEQYTIVGKTIKEVVQLYAELAGKPLLVPRWAFGYIAGGMKYSMLDEPRAADALMGFADKLLEHDIPCSGFQMSSGYTISEKAPHTRNVFTWNRHRFPDPEGFVHDFDARGIKLIMNVKPYVMGTHPEYAKLVKQGALFTDIHTASSAVARLWSAGGGESAEGGHLDLTSQAGFDWWKNGIMDLRKMGIVCPWNDNNEYVIAQDDWELALTEETTAKDMARSGHKRKDLGLWGRSMLTTLHAKASHDALLEVCAEERPFVLTRSSNAGANQYAASSWSGDNTTSWDGMRGANAISLNAGMSLLQCYGHDIGGFEGPQPSPELLARWVQYGCYSSRFAINCFKTSPENNNVGDVIEPWMYPEIIPIIRKSIKRRYEMIPYIYSLALESHLTATPPQRWVGWGYENDKEVWTNKILTDGETQYWLGDTLLVGGNGTFEPEETVAKTYLPKQSHDDLGFFNLNQPFQHFEAGQWVKIDSPWESSIPVLAKVGTGIPIGKSVQTAAPGDSKNPAQLPADDYRGVEIFPPRGSSRGRTFKFEWFEDDGIAAKPEISTFSVSYSCSDSEVTVEFKHEHGAFTPPWMGKLDIILPQGDGRSVVDASGKQLDRSQGLEGREAFRLMIS